MDPQAQLAPLEDACTVVLLRDSDSGLETLMLERSSTSRAFGGAWVFPGGKVDPEDRVDSFGAALDELAAARAAGLRELAEETGQRLSLDELVWLSQWTPMQSIPRRFRTWFMLAPAASELVVLNPEEHQRHAWLSPARALERHAAGEMTLVPPTWVTLHHLVGAASVAQALAEAGAGSPFLYNTHLLMPRDGTRPIGVMWAGDEAYPATEGAATGTKTGPGARHRLTISGRPWVFECTVLEQDGN
ncbi:NUDIX hydrolase [Specibacter sp. AOP5-B1-6]|uniref:NUDIX hydrolase n=1 Tax=Specibacter sp. AOP5-B1-6 TaxID=3457653 RepID=UPI00402B5BB3